MNGVDQAVAAGSVFALTPADFHEVRASSGSDLTYYNVVVEPGAWDERAERLFREGLLAGLPGRLPAATVYPELEPDLRRLWQESTKGRAGAASVMAAMLDCILVEWARVSPPASAARGRW